MSCKPSQNPSNRFCIDCQTSHFETSHFDGVNGIDLLGQETRTIETGCYCPLRLKLDFTLHGNLIGTHKHTFAGLSMNIQFSPTKGSSPRCDCITIKAFQVVNRKKMNGKASTVSGAREKRTAKDGPGKDWRVDWPSNLDPPGSPPLWDFLNPPRPAWTPGTIGKLWDPPTIDNLGEVFTAKTCFVGERKDKTTVDLGCLTWGFALLEQGLMSSDEKKVLQQSNQIFMEPMFECARDSIVNGAVKHWNEIHTGDGFDLKIEN